MVNLVVPIPDEFAERLAAGSEDLSRRALEALVADAYRAGRVTKPELRRLLGFETGHEIDGFLEAHDVYELYTLEDLDRERQTFDRLGR